MQADLSVPAGMSLQLFGIPIHPASSLQQRYSIPIFDSTPGDWKFAAAEVGGSV